MSDSAPINALVTGASNGIGREIARLLARDHTNLVLTSRRQAELATLGAQLANEYGIRAEALALDLSLASAADQLCRELADRHVQIDILVNNAGFAMRGAFVESDVQEQLRLLHLNIVSLTHLTRLLLPGMLQRRCGRILNMASLSAYVPGPLMATYFASKAYVLSFSEALANELAGSGVTVTCICPGPTHTGFEECAGLSQTKAFRSRTMTAPDVARIAYRAMMKGKRVVIPGLFNKLRAAPIGMVPRRMLAHFARKYHELNDHQG